MVHSAKAAHLLPEDLDPLSHAQSAHRSYAEMLGRCCCCCWCCCAGGGGGGTDGGGGGGGLIFQPSFPVTPGATFAVTVGAGGAGGSGPGSPLIATPGGNSAFGGLVAIGGGAGATSGVSPATSGGSGGGGAADQSGLFLSGGLGTPGQGESHNHMRHTHAGSCSFMPYVILELILHQYWAGYLHSCLTFCN
jgi:hypothetical protein